MSHENGLLSRLCGKSLLFENSELRPMLVQALANPDLSIDLHAFCSYRIDQRLSPILVYTYFLVPSKENAVLET